MKLVTGIEAIQSGKPWKHRSYDCWLTDNILLSNLTSLELRKKEFLIKEEPREFWINIDTGKAIPTDHLRSANIKTDNWIKVREVEK